MNGTQTPAKVYITAEPGVHIRTVQAYNKDTYERPTSYQLSSPRPAYFVINEKTGTISTARKIQQPVGHQFSLTVFAKFGQKFQMERQLLVEVVQKNTKQPHFASSLATFIIHQRTKIGTVFGRLSATDQSAKEYNRKLTYDIKMHNEPKVFGVDKNGNLRVIDTIPTNTDVLNFTAIASDNGYPNLKDWQVFSVKISNIPGKFVFFNF